jgi:catalase (peroxidase I)
MEDLKKNVRDFGRSVLQLLCAAWASAVTFRGTLVLAGSAAVEEQTEVASFAVRNERLS